MTSDDGFSVCSRHADDLAGVVYCRAHGHQVRMDGTMSNKYVCCFCGQTIEPQGFDVGALLYRTNFDGPKEGQREQDLFCHASCLESKVHPTVREYLLPVALQTERETEERDE